MLNNKIDYIKRGSYDELYTPEEAIECIIDYIPDGVKIIWEPTSIVDNNITKVLKKNGYTIINSHIKDGYDFLEYEPDKYDMILTNPPYSIKDKFLERGFQLNKPFMFLLPITSLEGKYRNSLYRDNNIQLIVPNKRFNFIEGKKGSWFQTSWFCGNCNLEKDLNFIEVKKNNK